MLLQRGSFLKEMAQTITELLLTFSSLGCLWSRKLIIPAYEMEEIFPSPQPIDTDAITKNISSKTPG